ncbi:hypothetical protein MPTK1_2g08920 [Marchantia polymorpha subsp. ruderalis]|uniref:Inward rectifier potassium channel C-terminal domain-containing protein n=1 Tax=Marchantia polymorpha TaxID=3197 RepID=A0A2R6XH25_MARPO|nr:hypothetical protein MARPO_0015s0176 [Marchantia polymorpha]BBN01625.1 hypothetical protein Mp_2g08920 [Marchantia polymorpha subsp. ruderalis]|eukprot:PTQ45391.1 hypothetical protein MARPO_0015s0176 [Marchantia polymorpha]
MQQPLKLAAGILRRIRLFVMGSTWRRSHDHLTFPPLLRNEHKDRVRNRKLPLVDERGRLNVETRGAPKTSLYWGDLFHTLVNMPNARFMCVLACTYTLLFGGFAVPFYYDAYNNSCIPGVLTFSHALWFSVQTSMTIGYGGDLTPDPRCTMTNVVVVIQSLVSLLVAYSLLGVFYVRFARPARRAQTLIFSKKMVMYEEDGVPVLAFRMANVRKHQIIEANVRLLIGLNNHLTSEDESVFHFTSLPVVGGSQVFLGLPSTVKHAITPSSPLYELSIQDMEDADVEILVLLEGVDASTSSKLQARRSYRPSDICTEHRFETIVARTQSGRRCVDFTKFDSVLPVSVSVPTRPMASFPSSPAVSAMRLPGLSNLHRAPDIRQNLLESGGNSLEARHSSTTSSTDSLGAYNAEGQDTLTGLRVGTPQKHTVQWSRKAMVRSMPDLLDSEILTAYDDEEPQFKGQQELEQRALIAEARAHQWKQMVIELASGIQDTLQQPTTAAFADAGPLIATAQLALSRVMNPK